MQLGITDDEINDMLGSITFNYRTTFNLFQEFFKSKTFFLFDYLETQKINGLLDPLLMGDVEFKGGALAAA